MAKGSWRNEPEYQHVEENLNPAFRPKVDHLLTQLRNHSALVDHPDAAEHVIGLLMHRFFVFERHRPEELFRLMQKANALWNMTLAPGIRDERNDRQLEAAQNAVTGDVSLEKQSLQMTAYGGKDGKIIAIVARSEASQHHYDFHSRTNPMENCNQKECRAATKAEKRNNVSPGPSHKSPIGWRMRGSSGFTVPGFPGKWTWTPAAEGDAQPDFAAVVDVLAASIVGRSPEIDLSDKGLRKSVRQIIQGHHWAPVEYDHVVVDVPGCACGKEFQDIEGWASHVRKLIWKELGA